MAGVGGVDRTRSTGPRAWAEPLAAGAGVGRLRRGVVGRGPRPARRVRRAAADVVPGRRPRRRTRPARSPPPRARRWRRRRRARDARAERTRRGARRGVPLVSVDVARSGGRGRRRRATVGGGEDRFDEIGLAHPGRGLHADGAGDGVELLAVLAGEHRPIDLLLRAHCALPRPVGARRAVTRRGSDGHELSDLDSSGGPAGAKRKHLKPGSSPNDWAPNRPAADVTVPLTTPRSKHLRRGSDQPDETRHEAVRGDGNPTRRHRARCTRHPLPAPTNPKRRYGTGTDVCVRERARGRVVGQEQDAVDGVSPSAATSGPMMSASHRSSDATFSSTAALVAGLVGGFDVEQEEVAIGERRRARRRAARRSRCRTRRSRRARRPLRCPTSTPRPRTRSTADDSRPSTP